ncbi:MAG: elongation factor P [bacterium]|nr:elongation factor P [bacterium]
MKYNDLKPGVVFIYEGQPYQVISADFLRKQQRKPVMQTEIKSLISGKVLQRNFHMNESFEEADIEKETIKYLYSNKGEFWFCDVNDPSNRFKLDEVIVGAQMQFVKGNTEVEAIKFNGEAIGVEVPIKMELKVKDTPPNVKGNTASGGDKVAELETGAKVTVPLHVNVGDIIRVNTQTGEYDTRIEKAKDRM